MYNITLSGNFRKHFKEIEEIKNIFIKEKNTILSTSFLNAKNPNEEFILFEGEKSEDPKDLENLHLHSISKSDFLYLVNPKGYIGNSSTMEIGYAISRGIPIYSKEKPEEFTLDLYIEKYGNPKEVLSYHQRHYEKRKQDNFPKSLGLIELQEYIKIKVKERGFEDESPKDLLVLLIEEVGEFAKAIRKYSGIKVDSEKKDKYPALQEEIADVLIYIIDLANTLNINLDESYRIKDDINDSRFWNK